MSTSATALEWPRELVDDVADAVAAVPGVAELSAGEFGEQATVRAIRTRLAGLLQCPVDVTIADVRAPHAGGPR
jgi:hypothetical protein